MKRYSKFFVYFWLFFEYHSIFVNAYLKSISTCIIIENRCLYNQLTFPNSYCYEENTFRIYKTNLQSIRLKKKREEINQIHDKNEHMNIDGNQYKRNSFNYYRTNDHHMDSRKKKYENKFLSIHIEKENNTVPLVYPKVNSTYISLTTFEESNNISQDEKRAKFDIVKSKNEEKENNNYNEIIDYSHKPVRVSLVQRATGLEDYSSEICKIDYENFSKRGVYLFDNNNHLVNKISIPIKTMYICHKDDATNCYLPKVDGFYLNNFQRGEVIELSGIQKTNTTLQNIIPEDGYSFINSELLPKTSYKFERDIIKCNYDTTEKNVLCDIVDGSEGSYYIQKSQNDKNHIIECSEGECLLKTNNIIDGFYINSGGSSMNNTLIYCFKNNCSFKTAKNNQYYIGIQHNTNVMIECNNNKCFYNKNKDEGYYINAGILIEDSNKPMIYCDSIHKCHTINIHYQKNAHYISGAHTGHLISCKNDTYCEEDNSLANIGYYIDRSQNEITTDPQLIHCYDQNTVPDEIVCSEFSVKNANQKGHFVSGISGYLINYKMVDKINYVLIHSRPETGFYLNNGDNNNGTMPLIYCEGAPNSSLAVSCNTIPSEDGYYLMQSSKTDVDENLYTQLIFCENSICQNKDPTKGYFKYALDNELIITCDGRFCYLEEPDNCQTINTPRSYSSGNCCIYQSQMYLITKNFNITSTTTHGMEFLNFSIPFQSGTTPKYAYFEVDLTDFPGIPYNSGSLYKITNYSMTHFPYNNYFILNNNNEQLTSLNTTITKYDIDSMKIFNCDSSTESCIPEVECSTSKFILYEPLKLGMKCTNYTLDILTTEGNYLDEDNNNHIIRCDNNKQCKLLTPSTITNSTLNGYDTEVENCYLLNSGYNNSTYPLIKCNKTSCELMEPKKGFYYDCEAKKIINYQNNEKFFYVNNTMEYPTFYINEGANSPNEQLISCTKNDCTVTSPVTGYYLSHQNDHIIHCKSSTECKEETTVEGYYPDANSYVNGINYILHCAYNSTKDMNCFKEIANVGFYISINSETLINCVNEDNICKTISKKPGIYVSAVLRNVTLSSNGIASRDLSTILNQKDKNLISCNLIECNELTEEELMAVPICEFSDNKCFISQRYSSFQMQTSLITLGGYCTDYYHSQLYFATNSIQTSPDDDNLDYDKIFSTIDENCIEASSAYRSYYYTVENVIYDIDDNQISQKTEKGFYFIDPEDHSLLNSNDIKLYNEHSIKLFECNGDYCTRIEKIPNVLFFVDINRRIFKYDPSFHKYFFAYDNDITCTYHPHNSCQVSRNITTEEFCINTNGQLVSLQSRITTDSEGLCIMMESNSEIFIFYKDLYRLSGHSAELIEEKGYYLINNNTRISAELKDFKDSTQIIILYGCNGDYCEEVKPNEGTYYYDNILKSLFKYENNIWNKANSSGYANVSLYLGYTHIVNFDIVKGETTITNKNMMYGNFYTVDQKMFRCNVDDNQCHEMEDTGYFMTTIGEIYYCEYNSKTTTQKVYEDSSLSSSDKGYRNILSSCIKKRCTVGDYYFINNNYYQCRGDSIFTLMKMEQCIDNIDVEDIKENHQDIASSEGFGKYIIHFPLMDKENYPYNIKYINYLINIHNNSTAEDNYLSTDYLETISGVFNNCRYDLETSTMVFDLICMNNYVSSAKQLSKQNEELLNKKDNGVEKGNMSIHDLTGILSFIEKRKNRNEEEEDDDGSNKESKKDKNNKVLEEFNITYKKDSDLFICSTRKYGYIECQKDNNNPDKCVPSRANLNSKLSK
ncbi:hypothetical protein PIROE2DRAFT_5885, partial [Piromyces sp. E2]